MRIKIFTTGGTIDKVYFDATSQYSVGNPQIVDILDQVNVSITFDIETLFMKDSLDMTDEDRDEIAGRVKEEACQRIIITHGTDSMVQTALTLGDLTDKTVVFVGSLRPARFKGSDAEFNIGFAMGAVQALTPGVYITMNGLVFNPEEVKKNRETNRFEPV